MPSLKIIHLYPDVMNLYGDLGNINTLKQRCQWRGIKTNIVELGKGQQTDFSKADIIFLGGGQDRGQKLIASELFQLREAINKEVEKGLVALTICGGYQLFGKYFKTASGDIIKGISVFDAYTEAGDARQIGNIVVDISRLKEKMEAHDVPSPLTTLVGFENHSGQTFLDNVLPLGRVKIGCGNRRGGGFEGAVKNNAFGTYLHGPLLPKNPHFADYLISLALKRRNPEFKLLALDDEPEIRAHRAALVRARKSTSVHL